MLKKPVRLNLAHLPTPLDPMPNLSKALEGVELWIKRDDMTGLAGGGNKTRKLEFLLADAQAQGSRTLVTRGAAQSNHCRQTAAAARHAGMECTLVLTGSSPAQVSGNLLLDDLLGAEVIWTGREDPDLVLRDTYEKKQAGGFAPYLIPYGGSNILGASAYTLALQELLQQDNGFDRIVFATSSGGTQAGLVAGARLFGFSGEILGISVDLALDSIASHVAMLAAQTAAYLGEPTAFAPSDIHVNDSFLGEGYGVLGELETEAIRLFAREEGILLDPVYTGRAAGGLINLIRSGSIRGGERVLFWHTGGTPALFAYADGLTQ